MKKPILASFLLIFACSSENDENNNNNSENALLVSEISAQTQGQIDGSLNFYYDGNKLTSIASTDYGTSELLNFVYEENKISRIDISRDTSQGIYSRYNFSYDNQNRIRYYDYCYFGNNNECDDLNTFNVTYPSNNTVTVNYIYDVGTSSEDTGTLTLQLDNNGNIIVATDVYQDLDENGNLVTVSNNASLQYDNFNSPFKNITGMSPLILFEIINYESVYPLSFSFFNNCISQNYDGAVGAYSYDYNDDNYPRQAVVNFFGGSSQTYNISYY